MGYAPRLTDYDFNMNLGAINPGMGGTFVHQSAMVYPNYVFQPAIPVECKTCSAVGLENSKCKYCGNQVQK